MNLVDAPRSKANIFLFIAGTFLCISATRMGFLVATLAILVSLCLSTDFSWLKLKKILVTLVFNKIFLLLLFSLFSLNIFKAVSYWATTPHTFKFQTYFNNMGGFPGYLNMLAKSLFGGDLQYEMASAIANYRIHLPSLFVSCIYSIYLILILYAFIHFSLTKIIIFLFFLLFIFVPGAIYQLSSNGQFNTQSHHLIPFFVLCCWVLAAWTNPKRLSRLIFVFLLLLYTQSVIALLSVQSYYSITYHLFFSKFVSELLSSQIFVCCILFLSFSLVITPFIPKNYLKNLVE
jgi:hypothetical protein